jgi:hypothetical protein
MCEDQAELPVEQRRIFDKIEDVVFELEYMPQRGMSFLPDSFGKLFSLTPDEVEVISNIFMPVFWIDTVIIKAADSVELIVAHPSYQI